MFYLLAGAVVIAVTAISFWICLPRNGVSHRFVGTEFEPYVAVAFCVGIALGFTMLLSGVIEFSDSK